MGVKYVMWFDVGVEGKSGGGGFGRQDIADFFLLVTQVIITIISLLSSDFHKLINIWLICEIEIIIYKPVSDFLRVWAQIV